MGKHYFSGLIMDFPGYICDILTCIRLFFTVLTSMQVL